jgi:hypothetical protein
MARLNGGTDGAYGATRINYDGNTTTTAYLYMTNVWFLTAADYLEFSVQHSSGGDRTLGPVYASITRL